MKDLSDKDTIDMFKSSDFMCGTCFLNTCTPACICNNVTKFTESKNERGYIKHSNTQKGNYNAEH